eukprot:4796832-Pyramimonas_sp.AAC.1
MAGLLAGVPAALWLAVALRGSAFCRPDDLDVGAAAWAAWPHWLTAPRVWPGPQGASLPWSAAALGLEPAAAYPDPWEGPDSHSE